MIYDQRSLEVLILATLRAYAVGTAFSSRDADGTSDFEWRRVGFVGDDYTYRRPAPPRESTRRGQRRRVKAAAVSSRIDPTKIRTRDQQKAVARSL